MTRKTKKPKQARTVALPRPKGTSARVRFSVTMHPAQLERMEGRAAAASMGLARYIEALLDSDGDELPKGTAPARVNWLEDRDIGELLTRRCGVPCVSTAAPGQTLLCTRPLDHDGEHDCDYLRPERIAADDARALERVVPTPAAAAVPAQLERKHADALIEIARCARALEEALETFWGRLTDETDPRVISGMVISSPELTTVGTARSVLDEALHRWEWRDKIEARGRELEALTARAHASSRARLEGQR